MKVNNNVIPNKQQQTRLIIMSAVGAVAFVGIWFWARTPQPNIQPATIPTASSVIPAAPTTASTGGVPMPQAASAPALPAPTEPAINIAAASEIIAPPSSIPTPASAVTTSVPSAPILASDNTHKKTQTKPKKAKPRIDKATTPEQQAENLYREAIALLQQGRVAEPIDLLQQSLQLNPQNNQNRQLLASLLIEQKQYNEAQNLLEQGLEQQPQNISYRQSFARLQVQAGQHQQARETLEKGLNDAAENAEYHAFYATLLQRNDQHDSAIQHYLTALKSNPDSPTSLVGLGISLQAQGKKTDAQAAFQRAQATGKLSPQLKQFVTKRLTQLKS